MTCIFCIVANLLLVYKHGIKGQIKVHDHGGLFGS